MGLLPRRGADRRARGALWGLAALPLALEIVHGAWGVGGALLGTPLFVGLILAAALSCIVRAAIEPEQRPVWAMLGAGSVSYAAGSLWYFSADAGQPGPFPTGPDVLWLSFFAWAAVALVLLVRGSQRAPLSVWLDGAMGGLAVTAVGTAVLFAPVLDGAAAGSAIVVVQLSYPFIELLLLGFLVVLMALSDWRLTPALATLGLAFVVLAVTDSVYLTQVAHAAYRPGTLLDAGWPTALALVGMAAWTPSRPRALAAPRGWRLVVVPAVSALIAITLHMLTRFAHIGALALVLASIVLVLAVVRLVVTLLALQRAERAAAAAEAHRRAVVGHARMVLFAYGADAIFTLSEGKGLAALGLTSGQVVGQSVFDVHRDAPEVLADARAALAGEELTSHVTVGDIRFETHYTPVRDATGKVREVIGVATDVTARYRAEQELQRSYALLRGADEERRELLASLVRAQEHERRRIAADIHDDSVQVMAAVGLRLEMLRRRADASQQEAHARLEETVRLSIARLRRLIFELRPPALDRQGLAKAIELYLHESATDGDLAFEVCDRLSQEPPEAPRIVLYRIALEALANVRKHARASRVVVELDDDDGGVLLTVTDDGVGGDGGNTLRSRPGHLGMTVMRERAEMAGGWWRIEPGPTTGTRARAWVPLPGHAQAPRLDCAEGGPGLRPDLARTAGAVLAAEEDG
jgi:PAS domain S-box-containing protein